MERVQAHLNGGEPRKTIVVPGNHDIPLYDVVRRFFFPLSRYRRLITKDLRPFHCDEHIAVLGINTASDRGFAFLTIFFLVLVLFIDWRLLRSKVGRAILSIKHSEPVAASYGINVVAYKLFAFVLSGVFAGLAGGLMAFRATTVVSNDFNFSIALLWVLMVVVGGLGGLGPGGTLPYPQKERAMASRISTRSSH